MFLQYISLFCKSKTTFLRKTEGRKGRETVLKENEKNAFYAYYEKCFATYDIFEVIRSGSTERLDAFIQTHLLDEMLDEVISDIQTARTTYICSAAVYYAQILLEGVPLNDSISILTAYTSLPYYSMTEKEIRHQISCMLYDYTKAVGNQKSKSFLHYSAKTNTAVQYIRNHIYEKLCAADIAAACHCSVSTVQHVFKAETGSTLHEFIIKEKTEKAAALLKATDIPCIQISDKLSFGSQSYFTECFKKYYECTPARYRKNG